MQKLKDSELRYRRLFETAQDGILILNAETGMIEDVNPYLIKMLGYSHEEFVEKRLWEVGAFRDIETSKEAFEALQENEYIRYDDLPLKTKEGRLIQVEFVSNVYPVNSKKVIQCNIRDITEHQRIIAALRENEKKYYDLVNQSPDGIFIVESSGNILTVNKAMCRELGFSEEEFLAMNIWDIIPQNYLDQYRERLNKILAGESFEEAAEYMVYGRDEKAHYIEVLSTPHYNGKDIIGFQGTARDITARKRAEYALQESEVRYRRLFESAQDGVLILDARTGMIEDVNPYLIKMLGYSREEFVQKRLWEVGAFRDIETSKEAFEALQENEYIRYDDLPLKTKYGQLIQVEFVSNVYMVGGEKVIQCNIRDITKRKQAEEKVHYQAGMLDSVNDAIVASDAQYRLTVWNTAAETLYGWKADEVLGRNGVEITRTEWFGVDSEKMRHTIAETGRWRGEATQMCKDGARIPIEVSSLVICDDKGQITGYVSVNRDITERKQAQERIRRQLAHITALSAIDRVIAGNFDLGISLLEILKHVTMELGVDAADILILNSNSQMLEYGAERGFRTKSVKKAKVGLGESYAGRVSLERKLVQIRNLSEEPDNLLLTSLLAGEDFVCYYGVPLIIKGQVKGVLEIFHRTSLEPAVEWLDFLNTLAGQTAIAIENSTLFESLQRSNSELALAYDATIEGWSHALDLRDKETEGHTQRVTEMAVKLARTFSLSEADLVQVRWGSLLHDIGKMGVPDGVLLKPGPLTDEEWVVMKMHPIFAYEMLSPIRYLRLALDIPYCHHEKWDGTGYPRGLEGVQIPLVARIFSVVDVWDALISDRPYRPAWTKEKVRKYIRASSGTHFDPQVVDMFMKISK